jgi:hypothetical protein
MQKPEAKDIFDYILAPLAFLTVALLGGIRFALDTGEMRFIAPPLVTLILGALVMVVFARGGLIDLAGAIGSRHGMLENASGAARAASIYFATAQVFNAVTPERGLLGFCFNLFYFLIFWNNLFVVFNPARLMRSLAGMLGASFALKYLLLSDLLAPTESWAKYILQTLMKTASLGALEFEVFAPATGYLAFATVALYLIALYSIAPRVDRAEELLYQVFAERYRLTPVERRRLLAAVAETASREPDVIDAEIVEERSNQSTS